MKISTSNIYRLIFLWITLLLLQPLETEAFFLTTTELPPHSTLFYIGFLLLVFHFPFVLLSFFFSVNGHSYTKKKHTEFKTGTTIFWGINSLFFAVLIYRQQYVYPGTVLWSIPTLCFVIGILRWRLPLSIWLLSTFYGVTVILLVLGGIYNESGFGPKDGIHNTYYDVDSKLIKSIECYDFGRMDGVFKQYYKNGQLKNVLTYHLDTLQGVAEAYYENVQLKVSYQNNNNEIQGRYHAYYENGKLAMKQWFEHGTLHGVQQTYYPTGQMNSQCTYDNGQKEAACFVYYSNGQLENSCRYKKGVGNYVSYYKSGQLKEKGSLNLDRKEGLWKTYHINEGLESIGSYKLKGAKRSVKDGLWKTYYANGQLKLIGTYAEGVRKGQWVKYFDTGEESDAKNYGL